MATTPRSSGRRCQPRTVTSTAGARITISVIAGTPPVPGSTPPPPRTAWTAAATAATTTRTASGLRAADGTRTDAPVRSRYPANASRPAAASELVITAVASSTATATFPARRGLPRKPTAAASVIQHPASAPGSTVGCRRSASGPRPATITAVAAALPLISSRRSTGHSMAADSSPASRHRPLADCTKLDSQPAPAAACARRSCPRNPTSVTSNTGRPMLALTTASASAGAGGPAARVPTSPFNSAIGVSTSSSAGSSAATRLASSTRAVAERLTATTTAPPQTLRVRRRAPAGSVPAPIE